MAGGLGVIANQTSQLYRFNTCKTANASDPYFP